MELKEARKIAEEEVLYIMGEEEKLRVRDEAKISLKDFDANEVRKAELKAFQLSSQIMLDKNYAASLIVRLAQQWRARKKLRLLCMESYEKLFDEESHSFYYLDLRNGTASWEKPKALGQFDLIPKNEWKLLHDSSGYPYYYNPSSMDMSWSAPEECRMCEQIVRHEWKKQYPVPLGQCKNFGNFKVEIKEEIKILCQHCWDELQDSLRADGRLNAVQNCIFIQGNVPE
eukprot:CAMPEP_0184873020 /NCGR_PEP_ID=MMETSP0580-20130426/41612_1 /TAXON_ID=1118495 /ORGANISM="Dactyliosolen fragilissimus" /LENGTH=228 /DNA_ID=CAMNT_0027375883 /DNA_START=1056 /DNA_END=1742 /DNA_ORIENTATION=-